MDFWCLVSIIWIMIGWNRENIFEGECILSNRWLRESDVIKAVDKHMTENDQLDDDISCILEEIPTDVSCKYCDGESAECEIFIDSLTNEYYLNVQTSTWDDYYDELVHEYVNINYCPYCGRKLGEK